MSRRRHEVFDEIEAIFKEGNLVYRARMFEYLLSRVTPPPRPLQWINPFTLASMAYQELEEPDYYTISVRYPDGVVLQESYYREDGGRAREMMLTVDEAREMMQECLAAMMREISGTKIV